MSSPNWLSSSDTKCLNQSICGQKVIGLSELPSNWIPPYVVLSTTGVESLGSRSELPKGSSYHLLGDLLKRSDCGVIVRSSAVGETIAERGAYESIECESSVDAVYDTAKAVLEAAKRRDSDCELAILIQRFEDRHAAGHLSNERRVSKEARRWFCELELPGNDQRSFRLRADSAFKMARSLRCDDEKSLKRVLREIARRMAEKRCRYHLEWLWNGERIFVVQSDREEEQPGSIPGQKTVLPGGESKRTHTTIFHTIPRKLSSFPKIRNVQNFKRAGLPCGHFYILDDPAALTALSTGDAPEPVRKDVQRLAAMPLVIRTDVFATDTEDQIMRPRTDACLTAEAALEFLTQTAEKLCEENRSPNEFAFIAHHFIPARTGAIARASYPSSLVRIDSTWGFPDGLSYYPHDSFEVDVSGKHRPIKKLRCKYEYMDVSPDGSWQTARTAPGWDWRSSLNNSELKMVARQAFELSKQEGNEIELMSFIGVDPATGLDPILPWFSTKEVTPVAQVEAEDRLYGGERAVISDFEELEASRQRLSTTREPVQIRLRPRFELLRSRPFLTAVASLALEMDASIELEGSVLGHAYYMLAAQGVRLRCVEPFIEPENLQRFGKLVRDLIPVRIERHGESPTIYRATPEELRPLLREKLLEESFEFYWSQGDAAALEELADIYDLIDALSEIHGGGLTEVRKASEAKRAERGGFEEGIVLVETSRRRASVSNSQLFEGSGPTQRTRARPAKRRPTVSDQRIAIPLIPSSTSPRQPATVLKINESTEASVQYGAADIYVEFRDHDEELERGGQLSLLQEESGRDNG